MGRYPRYGLTNVHTEYSPYAAHRTPIGDDLSMTQQTPQWANRIVGQGLEDPEQLLANPFNARIHPQFQQESLKAILDEVGWVDRVIVNRISGHVLDGHLRVALAITAGEQVPVEYVELNEREEQLILSTFDWITQQAVYDADHLETLLRAIGDSENDALQALLDDIAAQNNISLDDEPPLEDAGPQIDRGQELAAQYGTALGQIWQLGKHRLAIGDSTDKDVIEALMQGEKADMVFTDPPYNIASESTNFASDLPNQDSYRLLKDAEWDKDFDIKTIIPNLAAFSGDKSTVYICTSHFLFGTLYEELKKHFDFVSYVVWCKPNPMPSLAKTHWTWGTELILYAANSGHIFNFPMDGHALNWWDIPQTQANRVHPTQKPIEIPTHAILHSSAKNALILDMFLGSGTTLIAAHQTDRICYGCEISIEYAAVIINRWETLTGEKAALTSPRLDNTHEIPF